MIKSSINLIKYGFVTKSSWWFTATARTRARFSRTIIGSFWLGISNLICSLLLGGVYGTVFKVENLKEYFIYLSLGFSIWTILGGAINSAPRIFEVNSENIKNSNIHPVFYVLEEWAFQVQSFLQSFLLIIILITFISPKIFFNFIVFSPLNILNFLIFILWLPLLICLTAVKYQDLYQLIPIFTQLIFLLSPIIYNEKNLGKFSLIAEINPVYKVLAVLRNSIMEGRFFFETSLIILTLNLIMTLVTFHLLAKKKRELIFYI